MIVRVVCGDMRSVRILINGQCENVKCRYCIYLNFPLVLW